MAKITKKTHVACDTNEFFLGDQEIFLKKPEIRKKIFCSKYFVF